jgi:tRNA pseudouridine(38-40) synthase
VRWAAGSALALIGEPAMPAVLSALLQPSVDKTLRDGVRHVLTDNSSANVRQLSVPLIKALKGPEADIAAMQEAANHFLGTHDFTTFRDADCQAKSPVKTLNRFDLCRVEGVFGPEIQARVQARSFLHRQVRSMMGTLSEVGRGKWCPDDVRDALEARDRKRCGPVAPSDGLYLTHVFYET